MHCSTDTYKCSLHLKYILFINFAWFNFCKIILCFMFIFPHGLDSWILSHLQINESLEIPPFSQRVSETLGLFALKFKIIPPLHTQTREKREMNISLSGCSFLWRSGFSQTMPAKLYLVRQKKSVQNVNSVERGWANLLTGLGDLRDLCCAKDQRCYSTFRLIVCAWQGRGGQMCVEVVLLVKSPPSSPP